jgi:hypothetical protein
VLHQDFHWIKVEWLAQVESSRRRYLDWDKAGLLEKRDQRLG